MGVTGIVRIGWESDSDRNNDSKNILTKERSPGQPLFEKVGTAAYRCVNADDQNIYRAVKEILCLMCRYHDAVDSVFISLVKEEDTAGSGAGNAPPDGGEPGECQQLTQAREGSKPSS